MHDSKILKFRGRRRVQFRLSVEKIVPQQQDRILRRNCQHGIRCSGERFVFSLSGIWIVGCSFGGFLRFVFWWFAEQNRVGVTQQLLEFQHIYRRMWMEQGL